MTGVIAFFVWIGGAWAFDNAGHPWRAFIWPFYLGKALATIGLKHVPSPEPRT